MENLTFLLSGLVIGIIVFHTAIIAPTVFRTLEIDDAGSFLRTVFPKFFILISSVSLINVVFALAYGQTSIAVVAVICSVLMVIAYSLIPMTNRSRDDGQEQRFKLLHTISVLLTVSVLLMNLGVVFL
ncbi:MAG: hypothetical protein CL691_02545 [Cellvibrionales bacterium]|nr:hypothetical protein [Cellvibrionales bacterium]|tara:strand:- start:6562 stop:6945 length:384 start_codon:yes stop_codon:yes gene_type:complete